MMFAHKDPREIDPIVNQNRHFGLVIRFQPNYAHPYLGCKGFKLVFAPSWRASGGTITIWKNEELEA
ncbi:hypothetical protein AWY89_10730 [Pasteurella multocida subsp. multocida]|nr:hypothetical protein AWY89_10730 [Pasteurella multocida subsp. multocida]